MPHDIVNGAIGHNHPADHLDSHMAPQDRADDLQVLTTQFIDGFLQAADKTAYLRLAGIPFERSGGDGKPTLKLVDISLTTEWQVGTASPGFGTRELSYLAFPGAMVKERMNMALVYVSMAERVALDIRYALAERAEVSRP
ncbi:MAG: hypothetical protein AAGA32_14930 [Pseudomonadota bacterium]